VHRLSVGQQQRVAAARALMGCPQLIVADEPTSALDEANKEEFIQLLLRTAQQHDASVIVVSHDARLAERFDRVHTMHTAGGAHALA
jgi:putative ABC transport system ATP-binding protein